MSVLRAIFTFDNLVAVVVIDVLLLGVFAGLLVGAVVLGDDTLEVRAPLRLVAAE